MKQVVLIIILQTFIFANLKAQKIIESTSFEWASGPCCARGQDYNVTFELSGKHETIEGVQYILKNVGQVYGQVYIVNNDTLTTFQILMRTSTDLNGVINNETTISEKLPIINGEAFIELKIDGESYQIDIAEFTLLHVKAYP